MNEQQKALKLRVQGYSYNEIERELGIAKSTLWSWFRNLSLSAEAQKRLAGRVKLGTLNGLIKRNKEQTILAVKRAKETQSMAVAKIKTPSHYELLLIGAALYWAEGYKRLQVRGGIERTSHTISFTNSDPEMVKVFIKFLKDVLRIPEEKISLELRLFDHSDDKQAQEYWKEITELPFRNFTKTTYVVSLSSKGKRPFNRLPFGTIQVRVANTQKFHELLGLIEGLKKQLLPR